MIAATPTAVAAATAAAAETIGDSTTIKAMELHIPSTFKQ